MPNFLTILKKIVIGSARRRLRLEERRQRLEQRMARGELAGWEHDLALYLLESAHSLFGVRGSAARRNRERLWQAVEGAMTAGAPIPGRMVTAVLTETCASCPAVRAASWLERLHRYVVQEGDGYERLGDGVSLCLRLNELRPNSTDTEWLREALRTAAEGRERDPIPASEHFSAASRELLTHLPGAERHLGTYQVG